MFVSTSWESGHGMFQTPLCWLKLYELCHLFSSFCLYLKYFFSDFVHHFVFGSGHLPTFLWSPYFHLMVLLGLTCYSFHSFESLGLLQMFSLDDLSSLCSRHIVSRFVTDVLIGWFVLPVFQAYFPLWQGHADVQGEGESSSFCLDKCDTDLMPLALRSLLLSNLVDICQLEFSPSILEKCSPLNILSGCLIHISYSFPPRLCVGCMYRCTVPLDLHVCILLYNGCSCVDAKF